MARITTSRGVAVLRPMLGNDERLIGQLLSLSNEDKESTADYYRIKAKMLDRLDAAIISADWEGGFGELPNSETLECLVKWDNATDDDAVPQQSGTDSETK